MYVTMHFQLSLKNALLCTYETSTSLKFEEQLIYNKPLKHIHFLVHHFIKYKNNFNTGKLHTVSSITQLRYITYDES
jgi:hypothetical protein